MDEVKMLSDKTYSFTVGDNEKLTLPKSSFSLKKNDYGQMMYEFTYYKVFTMDKEYKISESEYRDKISAIDTGSRFVKLGEDVVNINQIKSFKKTVGYKTSEEFGLIVKNNN